MNRIVKDGKLQEIHGKELELFKSVVVQTQSWESDSPGSPLRCREFFETEEDFLYHKDYCEALDRLDLSYEEMFNEAASGS